MKNYASSSIRNITLVAHQGAGKTSIAEAMLFNTGVINRLGRVDDGNTTADYHPEEIKRKSTVNTSLIACEWKDCKINILDSPGFSDFAGEVIGAVSVADCIIMVMDAVAGVEVSTEIFWEMADERNLPIMVVMNKMDRENADLFKAADSIKEKLSRHAVVVQLPIGKEADFCGIVNLISLKAFKYIDGKPEEVEIPDDLRHDVELYREILIETAAEGNDELTLKYLEGETLTTQEIIDGLRTGLKNAKIVPVACCSAINNLGIDKIMDMITDFAPSPICSNPATADKPIGALVFKTMADPYVGKISMLKVMQGNMLPDSVLYNPNKGIDEKIAQLSTMQGKNALPLGELNCGDIGIITKLTQTGTGDTLTAKDSGLLLEPITFPIPTLTVAISPKSKGDEDKLGSAITRLLEEDPTLRYEKSVETKQTLLTGMGEAHINITIERLQRKYGVDVQVVDTKLPYRETIKGMAQKIEGKHKKQSGGHGQYGHVIIDIAPDVLNEFTFEEKIFGGSVPKQYIPAVEKGMREALAEGILAGFPVINVKITLIDGSYHDVDSSEMAFKIAANLAFKKACEQAKPILLEPIMDVEIVVPDQYMGDIMGDMNTRRGRIMGMEKQGKNQLIKAQAPLAEMSRYSIDLKSITQGRGKFTMKFVKYEEVPAIIAEKVIAQEKSAKEKE